MAIPWSDDVDREMLKMIKEGLSREAIAKRLSVKLGLTVSKNAVVGRLHRMGVTTPREVVQKKSAFRHYHVAKKSKRAVVAPVALAGGNPGGCQYIKGDVRDRNFCGADTVRVGSGAWCSTHALVVYERIDRGNGKKAETA